MLMSFWKIIALSIIAVIIIKIIMPEIETPTCVEKIIGGTKICNFK